ncbi:MAG TPA: hypothetical protein IAC93_04460, partial [Candidatus Limisoma gallistercoris]|nr:hypothetical protein [Candidatus Limisoma gallistercoris]
MRSSGSGFFAGTQDASSNETNKTDNMTRHSIINKFAVAAILFSTAIFSTACDDDNKKGGSIVPEPPTPELPELPVPGDIHKYKAPLYWSIYEYAREFEIAGIPYDQMD